jgi:hypothetical protein
MHFRQPNLSNFDVFVIFSSFLSSFRSKLAYYSSHMSDISFFESAYIRWLHKCHHMSETCMCEDYLYYSVDACGENIFSMKLFGSLLIILYTKKLHS